jgi:hypothetical protein
MRTPKTSKKTRFVPRTIFGAAVAGTSVIPICTTACGNGLFLGVANIFADGGDSAAKSESGPADGMARDTGVFDGYRFSVAAIGFDAGEAGDANDGGRVTDGGHTSDTGDAFSMSVTVRAFGRD